MTNHLPSKPPARASIQKKLDSTVGNIPLSAEGKSKNYMGSSASTNKNTLKAQGIPSSLPGGNDMMWLHNDHSKYRTMQPTRYTYNKGKDVPRIGSAAKQFNQGPLKADHNINVPSTHNISSKGKHGSLKPLLRLKSSSLTDISRYSRDLADIDFHFPDGSMSPKVYKNGFSVCKGHSSDTEKHYSESMCRSSELINSSKLKLSSLDKRFGENSRSNDADKIRCKYESFDTSSTVRPFNETFVGRHYRSLTDLKMSDDVKYIASSAKSSSCQTVKDKTVDDVDVKIKSKSSLVESMKKTTLTIPNGRRHSFDNGKISMAYGCGLVGLRNLGNTCFMNSILQCLCKTKLLRDYFWKKQYLRDLNEDHIPTRGRLAKAFGQLMNEMWSKSDHEYITPTSLKAEVQKFAVRFSGYHQQDAQEFLRFFIEGVHDDLNSIKRKPVLAVLDDSSMSDCKKSQVYWDRYLSREKSMIQNLFVGQLKSTLTCTTCEHRSVTYDPFWDLSLPLPSRNKVEDISIQHCFQAFTQDEVLDGDEKPMCEKCKKRRRCKKRFLIERFPKILVLHLKRFSGHRYRTKLDTKVIFPSELKLESFAANSFGGKATPVYSLYGISNHMGGTHGGHYTAYCKHPDSEKWHGYNDSRVHEISSNKLVSSSAYVLFYELISNGSSTG